MKTGIELIAEERQKQIDKHGFTGKHHKDHPEWYEVDQLIYAAIFLMNDDSFFSYINDCEIIDDYTPPNWNPEWFIRLCRRPYNERLVIAGALIAAELDRLKELEGCENE